MSARQATGPLMLAALAGIALLMTLKYFPGLENAEAYAGNVFQVIHPEAFPGDPYLGAERPVLEKFHQISSPLFNVIIILTGEIWLDDRFNAVVYLLLVIASLVGVDRIVTHMGLSDLLPRLAIQLLLMRDHQFFNNKVFLAHQPDFNHVSFAIPATIWLIYATVARKSLWVILGLSVLVGAASIRNAPFVIAFCLIMAAMNGLKRERIIVASLFGCALIVLYAVLFHVMPALEHERLIMWDILYEIMAPDQINPFTSLSSPWTMVGNNAIFAVNGDLQPGRPEPCPRQLRDA